MTRVALIDDHDIVRMGLKTMIEFTDGIEFAGELPNGKGAAGFAKKVRADVVLLDIRMPEVGGLEALEAIRRDAPEVKVLILTTSDLQADVKKAVQLGADGYVLKNTPPPKLMEAIRLVAAGEKVFPPEIKRILETSESTSELTAREMEILFMMSKGLSNSDIGRVAGISTETVKVHVKHILSKLGVSDRAEAVSFAFATGLVKLAFAVAVLMGCVFGAFAVGPVFTEAYTSDPAPLVVGDRLYVYTGHDDDNADSFVNKDWLCHSTTNLKEWTNHGAIASPALHKWAVADNAWASQCIERDGKFFFYTSVRQPDERMAIGVLVSDSPTGPFADPLGRPLVDHPGCYGDFDPTVFIDEGGQAYLMWGNAELHLARLNRDMTSLDKSFGDGGIAMVTPPEKYQDGPWLWKRGGKYYLAYTSQGFPAGIAYATSDFVGGPWKFRGWIMRPDPRCSGNQAGLACYKGRNLFFGWNRLLYESRTPAPRPPRERRSVSVTTFEYNEDGTIRELPWWTDCPEP